MRAIPGWDVSALADSEGLPAPVIPCSALQRAGFGAPHDGRPSRVSKWCGSIRGSRWGSPAPFSGFLGGLFLELRQPPPGFAQTGGDRERMPPDVPPQPYEQVGSGQVHDRAEEFAAPGVTGCPIPVPAAHALGGVRDRNPGGLRVACGRPSRSWGNLAGRFRGNRRRSARNRPPRARDGEIARLTAITPGVPEGGRQTRAVNGDPGHGTRRNLPHMPR